MNRLITAKNLLVMGFVCFSLASNLAHAVGNNPDHYLIVEYPDLNDSLIADFDLSEFNSAQLRFLAETACALGFKESNKHNCSVVKTARSFKAAIAREIMELSDDMDTQHKLRYFADYITEDCSR